MDFNRSHDDRPPPEADEDPAALEQTGVKSSPPPETEPDDGEDDEG